MPERFGLQYASAEGGAAATPIMLHRCATSQCALLFTAFQCRCVSHHSCIIVSRTSFQSFIRYCTPRDSLTNSRVVRGVWVPVPGLVATTCLVLSCPVLSCPVLATAWPRGRAIFGSLERFTGLLIEVRKRISFAMPFYTKMIMFTKTGSGQTKHRESTQKQT